LEIQKLVKDERSLGSNTQKVIAERAPIWRKQVTESKSQIANLLAAALETEKQEAAKRKQVGLYTIPYIRSFSHFWLTST
jgi:hypothetical protein